MTIKLPKIFLDSGNPQDIKKAKSLLGAIDGQTTNPSLVVKHPDVAKFLTKGKKLSEKELLDFYRQIIKQIEKEVRPTSGLFEKEMTRRDVVKIIPARLGEDSVALGAASVVIRNVFVQA